MCYYAFLWLSSLQSKFSVLVTYETRIRQKIKLHRNISSVLIKIKILSSRSTNHFAFSCLIGHPLQARLRAGKIRVPHRVTHTLFPYNGTVNKNSHYPLFPVKSVRSQLRRDSSTWCPSHILVTHSFHGCGISGAQNLKLLSINKGARSMKS